MGGAGLRWTVLQASRARRRWLWSGALLSGILALVLLAALRVEPGLSIALAALACACSAGMAAWAGARREEGLALHVDGDGAIWGRTDGDAAPGLRLLPAFVGSGLITLRSGRRQFVVWRDALPVPEFRRLCVHARWHVERADPAAQSESVPASGRRG